MDWLREGRSRRPRSMPIIGVFVADKADAGQAGTVTATAAEV